MTELVTFGETPLQFTPREKRRIETAGEMSLHAHGVESSAAIAAACLGTEATWLSKVPDTPLGHRVVSELHQHGIDCEVTWADDRRQGLTFAEIGAEPREDGRWHDRTDTAAASTSPGDIPMDRVQGADALFAGLSTPALSESAAETTQAIMRAGNGADALTAVELDYRAGMHDADHLGNLFDHIAEHVDLLLAHEDDARAVLDARGQPREFANSLVAEYDLEMVAITRSQHGAVVLHDAPGTNVIHERDAVETETVDPRGQHAAFVGGFLQPLIDGRDAAAAVTTGVATATLARTVPGPLLSARSEEIEALAEDVRAASR